MERLKPAKKAVDICQTLFGRAPENGMLARISNLERFLRREPNQRLCRVSQYSETCDVHVNTDRRTGHAIESAPSLSTCGTGHLLFFSGNVAFRSSHLLRTAMRSRLSKQKDRVIAFGLLM